MGNHCCSGKARSTTHSLCVFLALRTQHAMSMHLFVICGLLGSAMFSTLSHNGTIFEKTLLDIMCDF